MVRRSIEKKQKQRHINKTVYLFVGWHKVFEITTRCRPAHLAAVLHGFCYILHFGISLTPLRLCDASTIFQNVRNFIDLLFQVCVKISRQNFEHTLKYKLLIKCAPPVTEWFYPKKLVDESWRVQSLVTLANLAMRSFLWLPRVNTGLHVYKIWYLKWKAKIL